MTPRGYSRFFAGTCLVLLLPWIGTAQEKGKVRSGDQDRDGLIARAVHLMPPGFAAALDLTSEQRGQVRKLDQEFKEKRRAALTKTAVKVMEIVESMEEEEDGELAPVLAICHEITGGLLESRRSRMAYEQKMPGLLDDRQKDLFSRLKEMGPREWRQLRLAGGSEEAELPLNRLEHLQLTEEQKKKLVELRKEMQTRLRDILTEEQKRRLDESRDDRGRSRKQKD